jgi:hypothetical protein
MPVARTGEFLPPGAIHHTMPTSDTRNLRISPPATRPAEPPEPPEPAEAESTVGEADQNTSVDLGRIAWLVTVLACLIAVLILVLQGYYGYAAVTFAVAVAAGINLL